MANFQNERNFLRYNWYLNVREAFAKTFDLSTYFKKVGSVPWRERRQLDWRPQNWDPETYDKDKVDRKKSYVVILKHV